MVSATKDIFEDRKRHVSDNVENSRSVSIADRSQSSLIKSQWKHLKVGSIVKIHSDEFFPADLILLKSSNPSGLCYIETKNLDGETNLKHKAAIKEI
jgi:P-type E1-E2 ATPase